MWIVAVAGFVVPYLFFKWYQKRQKISDIAGRHVFITGCDTGFGHLLAIRLDEMGLRVFAGCLTERGRSELQLKVSSRLVTVLLDVTNEDSIKDAVNVVQQNLPKDKGLWALVNNAGILGQVGPVEWLRKNDYLQTLEVNFFGLAETTRQFLPLLRMEKGRLINTSSISGSNVIPMNTPYCISKHAVEVYSDSLRPQALQFGVSVHLIIPAAFKTGVINPETIRNNTKSEYDSLDEDVRRFYGEDYCNRLLAKLESNLNQSEETNIVIDAFVHALLSVHPRYRYRVGAGANTAFRLMPYLPEWSTDSFFSSYFPHPTGCSGKIV